MASWRCQYAGVVPDPVLGELSSPEAVGRWEERWRESISNPPTSRHRVLVAVSGGAGPASPRVVVGFASAGPATDADRWPGTDAELYELRVQPSLTRQGHGGRLLHAAADTLAEDGFHTACTWTLEADLVMRVFLEASGWALDGARADLDVGINVPAVRLHTTIREEPVRIGEEPVQLVP